MMEIIRLSADQAAQYLPDFCTLLMDVVNIGGTVGFLPPISEAEARTFWQEVQSAIAGPNQILLAAFDEGRLVGSVQLILSSRSNGRHRAEVAKLLVHPTCRRRGIGRALMQSIEAIARQLGRTTLVLDTRQGEPSETLYASLGWTRAGTIPNYAQSSDGSLHTTVIFYKLLT